MSTSNPQRGLSETSPLLSKPSVLSRHPIDPSSSISPEGADPYVDNDSSSSSAAEDGGDIERQVSNGDISKHQGLPEVKARMKYIFPAIAVGVFLTAADQTLVVSTYSTIGTDLKALNNTSWIATAYFLTLSAFQPLYGKLSDIFGRKSCLLFGYIVFGLGCLFCGLARNMTELILARAFAGIGGGGMNTVVSILMSDVVPLRERGTWQGYVNIIFACGSAAGAPLGGLLADSVGWRWSFICQVPLCVVAFIAVSAILNLPKQDHSHWKEKFLKIDFLGALVLVMAVFGLLLGLDHGSNVSWSSPVTIAALCSTPLFGVFILVEKYVASHPFAPLPIIVNRSLFACYLCNFFSFGGWLACLFYIPLYFQIKGGYSASQAGLLLVPCIFSGVSGSLFGGKYMQRTGRYYWITVIAYSSLLFGLIVVWMFAGGVKQSIVGLVIGTMICSFSNGLGVTTTLIGLIANASHSDQAVATACSYLFRSLGSVFGISMCATAFNQFLRKYLRDALSGSADADEIALKVRESLLYIKTLEPALRELVRDCYAKSARMAIAVSVGVLFGSTVCSWFIREKRLK
ncbi:MFS general substrate transporter [Delitschia confertaspora ATCC 74209]|uniref:MFS general substrate transporter n=1 Tax=Delitschia confertaspora ATCC 74209 TaxID=1513339 RepID=A0A9P4JB76_9PLEO|nr:MFS general substrate transporter [Delitschia confertaspora ATCC 74209]